MYSLSGLSYKNQLQEYYQKRGEQLPLYSHIETTEGWDSTVEICDGRKFHGTGKTKKFSDQDAAKLVLDSLFLKSIPLCDIIERHPGCILVLIDLENSPKVDKEWFNTRWTCCQLEAFVGKLSSHATKNLKALYPFVDKFHIIDSGHQDVVDHSISFRTGQWLENIPYGDPCNFEDAIFIVSRDRFASALIDVLKQAIRKMKKQPEVENFINMNDCFNRLTEMSLK